MTYEHDMSEETAPKRKVLIPEGWRKTKIKGCKEQVSKAGNNMFVFEFLDITTDKVYEVHAIATPKKRYLLKKILSSCNVGAASDGVYKWDIPDVIGKEINVLIEHEPNEYINREGVTVKGVQHRVSDVDELAWDN